MAESGVRAPLAALVLVFGATLAAYFWQQHAAAPDGGSATGPASPPVPQDAQKPAEAQKTAEAPKPPQPDAKASEPPQFDVVRVEPTGEAVVAGKGEPGAKVELLASGKVVAEAKADSAGNFVILPSGLAPGGYDLTLRQTPEGKPAVESSQSVAVSIPAKGSGQVVVALSEPGKPTKILPVPPIVPQKPMVLPAPTPPAPPPPAPEVAPPPPAAPPPAAATQSPQVATAPPAPPAAAPPAAVTPPPPPPGVAIRSAELENGNGFFASGTAAAGARVRIYLNDTPLAEVVAGPDGQWTVTIKKGLAGGHYTVRADAGSDGAVTSRAEVPFDVPAAMAQAAPSAQPLKAAPAAPPVVKAAPAAAPPAANPSAERGPEPPSAPNPSEVVAAPAPASPSVSVRETAAALSPNPPAPRPDLAAGATPAPARPAGVTPAAPTKQAEAAPPKSTLPPAGAPLPNANAVIEQVETAVVVPGDNLWNISRARLGHGKRFTQIYAANSAQIRNPRLIYPGQVLVVPPK